MMYLFRATACCGPSLSFSVLCFSTNCLLGSAIWWNGLWAFVFPFKLQTVTVSVINSESAATLINPTHHSSFRTSKALRYAYSPIGSTLWVAIASH